MAATEQPDGPQYVYAVVPAGSTLDAGLAGIDERPVGVIRHGPIAALTSPVAHGKIRPSRANLLAHQGVVSTAHARGPVLPVRFGTVMPDSAAVVSELLAPRRHQFEELLEQLDGKDEFRVKCRYLQDVALREIVARNRTIRRLREKTAAARPGARPNEQIALGEMVMAELDRLRRTDATAVMEWLSPHVLAWELVDDPAEDVPLHAALLVDRRAVPQVEATLERVADKQRERMHIELIGPLPLWDFTDLSSGAA